MDDNRGVDHPRRRTPRARPRWPCWQADHTYASLTLHASTGLFALETPIVYVSPALPHPTEHSGAKVGIKSHQQVLSRGVVTCCQVGLRGPTVSSNCGAYKRTPSWCRLYTRAYTCAGIRIRRHTVNILASCLLCPPPHRGSLCCAHGWTVSLDLSRFSPADIQVEW